MPTLKKTQCIHSATIGSLVLTRLDADGKPGIVVDIEKRRDHSYLDLEPWFLVSFGGELCWKRGYDCQVLCGVEND